ncbi:hypothetical protein HMPREF3207_03386 [Citrobacter koseri]|nr:hypothetical protein HMPREF3207_03386 [Citrobacter koseri]
MNVSGEASSRHVYGDSTDVRTICIPEQRLAGLTAKAGLICE